MSETKFTPGPWAFSTSPQPNGCPIVGAKGLMVAMLAHTVNQPDQREIAIANAKLIAAAPDLYKALIDLQMRFRTIYELYAATGAYGIADHKPDVELALISSVSALAKAHGENNG